ncbi:MFS family permease [Streptacidiphilus sp. BW17]|uniref:MFS transporter n=1 Tax=Streptacidiphilus sp. BW17 TaxID=3156274 RepID=UPI0035152BDF
MLEHPITTPNTTHHSLPGRWSAALGGQPDPERDWRLRCYVLRASDGLGSAAVMYFVPLMILTLTNSAAWTGISFVAEWVPRLITIGSSGPIVDRYSPQAVALVTSVLRVLVSVAALVCLMAGGGGIVALLFGVAVGMLAEVSFLASESLGAQASRRAGPQGHHVQSTMTAIDQFALLVGPLLGGALLLLSPAMFLGGITVVACVTTTAAWVLRDSPHNPPQASAFEPFTPVAAVTRGLGTIRRTPALAWLVGSLAIGNLVSGVLQVSAPITVTKQLDHSSAAVGWIWSMAACAALLAVTAARRAIDRHGLYPVGLIGAVLMCTATVTAGLSTSVVEYAASIAAMMAAEGALTVVLRTARARLIPADGFATALAASVLLVLAPFPLAGALVAAAPITSMSHLVLAVAAVQVVATVLCFRGLWKHRADYEHHSPATNTPTS